LFFCVSETTCTLAKDFTAYVFKATSEDEVRIGLPLLKYSITTTTTTAAAAAIGADFHRAVVSSVPGD